MTLGKRIKETRANARMTQEMLAIASGIKQQTLSKLERDISKGTVNLVPIARALNVDPEWLETGKTNNKIAESNSTYNANVTDKNRQIITDLVKQQLKEAYSKANVSQQINMVISLVEALQDQAIAKAIPNMQANTILRLINIK